MPRVVNVPTDFQTLLNQQITAKQFFEQLAYTYKKEYVQWIESAKRPETRTRRMNKAIEKLLEGTKGI